MTLGLLQYKKGRIHRGLQSTSVMPYRSHSTPKPQKIFFPANSLEDATIGLVCNEYNVNKSHNLGTES